jgi:nitric oxide reductase NorQ protein
MIPQKKPFFISQSNKTQLESILATRTKHPVNIMLKGKHGMGKSECARQLAASCNLDYNPVPIGSLQEVGQLWGRYELINGETKFMESQFSKTIKTSNSLLHLEELNRPESPKALNDLFPILDDGRAIMHEQLGEIKVADGIVFVATLNEGFEYTGIDPLDAAMEDRFHIIHLDYLPPVHESSLIVVRTGLTGEVVTKLLQFVNKLRFDGQDPIHVSTRRVLMMAELIQAGLDMRSAIIGNIALDKDKLESILLHLDFSGSGIVVDTANGTPKEEKFVVL